jgi:hypothetical protein
MKPDLFTLGIISLAIIIIAAIAISASSSPTSTPAKKYQTDETNRPSWKSLKRALIWAGLRCQNLKPILSPSKTLGRSPWILEIFPPPAAVLQ